MKDDTKDDVKELPDIQKIILSSISSNDKITVPELTRKAEASESPISREIKTLRDDLKILKRVDECKDGHWVIVDYLMQAHQLFKTLMINAF